MITYSPVIMTVYNRLGHLQECINSLLACEDADNTEIYISSDAPYREEDRNDIEAIREYINSITGFARVISFFQPQNKGVLQNYHDLVKEVFKTHDRFIFLEDDVQVAPDFLQYMNGGLTFYEHLKQVFSISAFSFSVFYGISVNKKHDVYFTNRFCPWGFGTWKDRYNGTPQYSLNEVRRALNNRAVSNRLNDCGKDLYPAFLSLIAQNKPLVLDFLNTFHMVRNNFVTVVPYQSKSFNIGHDGSGDRTTKSARYLNVDRSFLQQVNPVTFTDQIDQCIDNQFNKLHFNSRGNNIKLILNKMGILGWVMKAVNAYRGKY